LIQARQKDQAPLAKSVTSRSKSRSSAGKRAGATKSGAAKSAGKKSAGQKFGAKKSDAKKFTTKKSKSGDKPSLRSLAKASVKASSSAKAPAKSPVKTPAAKPKAPDSRWLKTILASLNDMKAEDTVTIDLSDKSSIGDTMVVTTGRSNVHLAAIADRVVKDLKAAGMTGIAIEGLRQGDWVVIDTGSVLVHVFRPEVRAFYAIEKMWTA
jgi:ribosome-associated protein